MCCSRLAQSRFTEVFSSVLSSILHHIDRIYGLDLGVAVEDFLITGETCYRLGARVREGSVLVQQGSEKEEVQLGVYIDESSLTRLREIDLRKSMTPRDFAVLLTAIEEVSHFAYLCFSADRDRTVSELELELQAEVDKFITSSLILASRSGGRVPLDILDRLFDDFVVRSDLDAPHRERYLAASSLASRYCAHLVRTFFTPSHGLDGSPRLGEMLVELRRFYRLSQPGKIGRIHQTVYA